MPARAIWPTEEEVVTIYWIPRDAPQSQRQLLKSDDHYRGDEENLRSNTRKHSDSVSEVVRLVEAQDIELLKSALAVRIEGLKQLDLNEAFLMVCEEGANLEIIRLLLDAGADINAVLENGDTALHIACRVCNEALTKLLIEAGADINMRGRLGRTPLHVTAVVDFPFGATLLLQSGADIEAKDDSSWTPLHQSCDSGTAKTQKVLISACADIECVNDEGWTPLHEAACWGNIENAAILLAAKAKIDIASGPDGFTPLHMAVLHDKKDMVRYLLESGSDARGRTSTGFTSLQLAVLVDSQPVVIELLQWSTEHIDQKSVDGSTAIHIAAGRGLRRIVNLLRECGADVTLRDGDGLTPSDVATKYGHYSIARIFDEEPPKTSRMSRLCAVCEEANIRSLLERDRGLQRISIGTHESVRQRTDCPFCVMLLIALPMGASKYVFIDGAGSEIAILRTGVAVPRLEVQFGGMCHGYVQEDDELDLAEYVGSIALEDKYVAVKDVDYSLIRSWVGECEEAHNASPLTTSNHTSQSTIQDILLIDVEQQCVVSGTFEQRYVALSYVWGRTPGFQATKNMESALKTQGFLRTAELPKVIRDAIDFVEKLGEQYIWIDSLCILQDDRIQKQLQLAQTDLIYNRACVTLVALTAFDTQSGLAGLQTESRASAWSTEYVNGQRLVSKPAEFDNIFEKSKYSGRAWTLQENILSPRCLYVTNHQVYYSCHGTLRTEDRRTVTAEESAVSRSVNWFADAMMKAQQQVPPNLVAEDWMHHFLIYAQLVANCTSRNLSDPRDVLNATLGPLTVLYPYLGPFSLAGLPDLYLDHSLLWAPTGRGMKTRNEYFPSWSWAGWNSQCTYFCKPVYLGSTGDPITLVSAIEGLETFWMSASGVFDQSNPQRGATGDLRARVVHVDNTLQSLSLNHAQDHAAAAQVLTFNTEIIHRNALEIGEERPKLRMILLPEPVITIFDKDGIHCGVLYDDFDSLCATVREAESSGWFLSFILLSRTDAPPLSQDFFFNAQVYERRPQCLLNVMLVKHLHDPTRTAKDRGLRESCPTADQLVTQKFERVAIGQIHSDV